MHILITGSSGLIGTALNRSLHASNHGITCVSRKRDSGSPARWDIEGQVMHLPQTPPVDAVIHLAGESIASGLWTTSKKDRILTSRVEGTRLLCKTLASLSHKPDCLISASAIGFYGHQRHDQLNESSDAGHGFLAEVCQAWEEATRPAADAGIRVVHARLGVVLDGQGGMLARMRLPFRLGLGGPLGHGQQTMSWVSLTDLVRSFEYILTHADLQGPVNITAPNPVTNQAFTQALAHVLHRPAFLRVPTLAITTLLGDFGRELLLANQHVTPEKLLQAGFHFEHPNIHTALEHSLLKA
jgi:uncharacterized protein (TIGR01777 family)